MGKNLVPKIILIVVLILAAAWVLYPPGKTLKPGIDLAGGTSLIYEIDTHGMAEHEKTDLAQNMITVLRRRIDPAGIQNLVWRPQGNTRFEIQMPLASAKAREKRYKYEKAMSELLEQNINPAVIMRCLDKPADERKTAFEGFAKNSPDRMAILEALATAYDENKELRNKSEDLATKLKSAEDKLSITGLELDQILQNRSRWAKLEEQHLAESLREFLGSDKNVGMLAEYIHTYVEWAKVVDKLIAPESGKSILYENAKRQLDKLNLTEDRITSVLEMPAKTLKREYAINELKTQFPDGAEKIDNVVAAFEEYRPFQGRLDDPTDLQRMLKGAGILEFRILPTTDPQTNPELDVDEITRYVEALKVKGPKYASDDKYVWCEVENIDEWKAAGPVVVPFGDKHYVLASNKENEVMLRSSGEEQWRLEKARPGTEYQTGRRAIDFSLNERGGRLFYNVTGKNINRPLCILLDGIAISAPNIRSRISTHGQITGNFSQTEVEDSVNKLNAGSLPARLIESPISVRTIGPSIGADNRDQGIKAGFIGVMVVMACMAGYYMLGGSIADVALLMNLLFTLAIMSALRATFTLAGIAGTILTIGMSVDANVLIFERIREEQQRGSSLATAIKNGYEKAFSAIFDSNLTTMISAAVLYWVGSEDIKGFAIVLMLGLGSNLFTAVFVTRVIFDWLLSKKLIKGHLVMLQLIRRPNINWMRYRPVFFTISGVLTIGGLFIFFTRDDTKNNKYDIEFTSGTSVQINLKDGVNLSRQEAEDRIHKVGLSLNNRALVAASVYSIGKTGKAYEINTTETNKTMATVTFATPGLQTAESITAAIKKAQDKFGDELTDLVVVPQTGANPATFAITTSQLNKSVVKSLLENAFPDANISEPQVREIVNNAILSAFADELQIQQNLQPKITATEKLTSEIIDSYPELVEFIGGIKITCEIEKAATAEQIDQRIKDLRFKPDTRNLPWYHYEILNTDLTAIEPNLPVKSFVYVSVEPEAGFRELTEDEWRQFVENETTKVVVAARLETSLPRVTQISPSVGAEARARALIAIVLSLGALLVYIWFRFGNLRYGLGAVVTLFHDTCVTVGAVTACTYIAGTIIGEKLLIGDFKINLAMIAAFLTLIGYSLNDTIVVYDRIRENRRKGTLTPQIINDSINDTLSRTLLTGTTTLFVVFIMYVFGGQGLRGFNFAMLFGIIEGTYSSIAISAPILLFGAKAADTKAKGKPPTKQQPMK